MLRRALGRVVRNAHQKAQVQKALNRAPGLSLSTEGSLYAMDIR